MQNFLTKIQEDKVMLLKTLTEFKVQGKTIVGYGAPAKATTLLHYLGIGADLIDFIVDDSPLKVGRYMPGNHIPIVSSKELYEENPDYVLILAWNFKDSIIQKLKDNGYKGKCIIPW